MTDRQQVRARDGMLEVGERQVPLVSGEVQFWRMDPEDWRPALEAVVELGVPIVSSYLSWRRHEVTPGVLEWGRGEQTLNVRRFVELCGELGLLVQIKPGPWICAEEPGGGYPDWLMADTGLLALGHDGEPVVGYNPPFLHPVPSLVHPRYLAHVERWFDAVWDELGDLRFPAGPIIAVQLDNEPSYCFQHSLYFADHHPLVVDGFRDWLSGRYDGDVEVWRAAWGADAGRAFDEVEAPRPPGTPDAFAPASSSRAVADWVAYGAEVLVGHLAVLERFHDARGCADLLTTVNLIDPPVHEVPLRHRDVLRATRACTGVDNYYVPTLDGPDLDRLAVTAATARAAGEQIVWAPELMAGIWRSPGELVEYPDPTADEQAVWWGAAMAYGYQGFNLYMLVDRENWELAPLDPAGGATAFTAPVVAVRDLLRAEPDLLRSRLIPDVQVAWHYPDAVDAYTVTGTARTPDVAWGDPARRAAFDAWKGTIAALRVAGYSYDLWDTEEAPAPGVPVLVPEGSGVSTDLLDAAVGASAKVVTLDEGRAAGPVAALVRAGVLPAVRVTWADADADADAARAQLLAVRHDLRGRELVHVVLGREGAVRLAGLEGVGATLLPSGTRVRIGADGVLPLPAGHHVLRVDPA